MNLNHRRISLKLVLSLVCTGFFMLSTASAASSPEARVKQMVESMKRAGSPVGMMDYVHWESAMNELPAEEMKRAKITSPEKLRRYMKKMFTDPNEFLMARMEPELAKLNPQQAAMMRQQFPMMKGMFEQKMKEMKDKIRRTDFTVGKATVNGELAQVPVTTSVDGKTKNDTVNLIKVNNEWYLRGFQGFRDPK